MGEHEHSPGCEWRPESCPDRYRARGAVRRARLGWRWRIVRGQGTDASRGRWRWAPTRGWALDAATRASHRARARDERNTR